MRRSPAAILGKTFLFQVQEKGIESLKFSKIEKILRSLTIGHTSLICRTMAFCKTSDKRAIPEYE